MLFPRYLSRFIFISWLAIPFAAIAACPAAPDAVRDIDAYSYYTDSAHSIIDPQLKKKNEAAVKPLEDFLRAVSKQSDRYLIEHDNAAARCAGDWLVAWARDGAMLGKMHSAQAEYHRKWELAGLALAYLKVKTAVDEKNRRIIEPWFDELAVRAEAFFDEHANHQRNNHYYWVGLAAGATALATGNERHWRWARDAYANAMKNISVDGTLPLELDRAGRALAYHNYALAPLIVLAELSTLRGENWYAMNDGAIHRLVKKTTDGIRQPSIFQTLTGKKQEVPQGNVLGWIEFYDRRFPDRGVGSLRIQDKHFVYPHLGGDLTEIAKQRWRDVQPTNVAPN